MIRGERARARERARETTNERESIRNDACKLQRMNRQIVYAQKHSNFHSHSQAESVCCFVL